jgi:hypothetical protein
MVASGPRTFTRKADAERHLAAVEVAKLSGAYVSDANPVTVGEYARSGMDASSPADHSNASPSQISKHIDGTKIGSMRLAALRPSHQAWVSDRSQVLSPGTPQLVVALWGPSSQRPSKIGWWRPAPRRGLACRAPSKSESSRCLWRRCRRRLGQCQHEARQW